MLSHRNEHDSFAAFTEPKIRALIVPVFISVVHDATKRTEPVDMNAAATTFCAPIVSLASRHWDFKFLRFKGPPSNFIRSIPCVAVQQFFAQFRLTLVDLFAISVQKSTPDRDACSTCSLHLTLG